MRRVLESAIELERRKHAAVEREDYEEAKVVKDELARLLQHAPALSTSSSAQRRAAQPARPAAVTPAAPRATVAAADDRPIRPSPPLPRNDAARRDATSPQASGEADAPPPGFWGTDIDPDDQLPVAEPLTATGEEPRALIAVFGEYLTRCVYSSHIKLRIAALQKLQASARDGLGSEDDIEAVLVIVAMGLREHATPLAFTSAARLLDMVSARASTSSMLSAIAASPSASAVCVAAVDALGATSAQVADAAKALVTRKLPELFGSAAVVKALLRPGARGKKSSTLWRPTHAKIAALDVLLDVASPEQCGADAVVDWLTRMDAIEHPNQAVRDAARQLLARLARARSGAAVETALRDRLSPQLVDRVLASVDGLSHACMYCHATGLADEGALDLHYWGECAMLAPCPRCSQVVEVARLNEHLLSECAHKQNHRACPRCKEAIAAQFFEQHVRRNTCLEAKPTAAANRCPLCHSDVAPGDQGWLTHLVHEGCPKSTRAVSF